MRAAEELWERTRPRDGPRGDRLGLRGGALRGRPTDVDRPGSPRHSGTTPTDATAGGRTNPGPGHHRHRRARRPAQRQWSRSARWPSTWGRAPPAEGGDGLSDWQNGSTVTRSLEWQQRIEDRRGLSPHPCLNSVEGGAPWSRKTGYLANILNIPPLIFRVPVQPGSSSARRRASSTREANSFGNWGFDQHRGAERLHRQRRWGLYKDAKEISWLLVATKAARARGGRSPRTFELEFKLDASVPGPAGRRGTTRRGHQARSCSPALLHGALLWDVLRPDEDDHGTARWRLLRQRPPACTLNYGGLSVECAMTDLNIKLVVIQGQRRPAPRRGDRARSRSRRSRSTRWSARSTRLIDVGRSYDRKGIGTDFLANTPIVGAFDLMSRRCRFPDSRCLNLAVHVAPGRRRAQPTPRFRPDRFRRVDIASRRRTSTRSSPARRSSCWRARYLGSSEAWWLIADANPAMFPARARRRARSLRSRPRRHQAASSARGRSDGRNDAVPRRHARGAGARPGAARPRGRGRGQRPAGGRGPPRRSTTRDGNGAAFFETGQDAHGRARLGRASTPILFEGRHRREPARCGRRRDAHA